MSARKTESRGPAELGVSVSAGSGHRPSSNPDAQDRVTRVYDRVAQIYDIYDAPMEWLGGIDAATGSSTGQETMCSRLGSAPAATSSITRQECG